MEDFKHKNQSGSFNGGFRKDPLNSDIMKEGYDYFSALEIIEQQKGKVDRSSRTKDGSRVEKVINVLMERSTRWCVKNYYAIWLPNFQIIRKKIDRSEKLSKEDIALLKAMACIIQPLKINELGTQNYNCTVSQLYDYYLKKLNQTHMIW